MNKAVLEWLLRKEIERLSKGGIGGVAGGAYAHREPCNRRVLRMLYLCGMKVNELLLGNSSYFNITLDQKWLNVKIAGVQVGRIG